MKKVLLAIGLVLCLAAPVCAQSSSHNVDWGNPNLYNNDSQRATAMMNQQQEDMHIQERENQTSNMQQQINQQQQQIDQQQQQIDHMQQ